MFVWIRSDYHVSERNRYLAVSTRYTNVDNVINQKSTVNGSSLSLETIS